jgi:CheY-like chemotaxis protein
MPNGNDKKYILLVEDREEHRDWFKGELRTVEMEYSINISVTDSVSFEEVGVLVKSVENHEKKFDCAVVDMEISKDIGSDRKKIDWGIQALKEIEKILELDKILIVTAYKRDVLPYLSDAEKKRVRTKDIYMEVFRDNVATMLGLKKAP